MPASKKSRPTPAPIAEGVYLPEFSPTIRPRQTPFDVAGPSGENSTFYYLINRYQRLSYLMNGNPSDEEFFSMETGRSQLWILVKVYAAHPAAGDGPRVHPDDLARKEEIGELGASDWVRQVYIVLREPVSGVRSQDHVFATVSKDDAMAYADDYARQTGFRTVVGWLVSDIYWN